MQARPSLIRTALGAILLQPEMYSDMRDDPRRLPRALSFVLVVGVLAGAATACSQLTQWGFSPPLDAIKSTVLSHLTQMDWYRAAAGDPDFQFMQWYDFGWNIAKAVAPSPTALVNLILRPLSLLIGWILYGLLAHLAAKLLGGQGSLGQTLGCTAIATTPQLLNLILIVPYASVAGIGVWALACNFTAVRTAHNLTGWRALIAALLPYLVLGFFALLLGALGLAIAYFVFAQRGGVQ